MRKKYKLTEDQQKELVSILKHQILILDTMKKNEDGSIDFTLELKIINLKHIKEIIERQPALKFYGDIWQIIYELEQEEITREIKKENK